MKNIYNIPTVQGENVHSFVCKLESQQAKIRSVTVDNSNSQGITVKVYAGNASEVDVFDPVTGDKIGVSSQFPPYIVVPGRTVTISMDGPATVTFFFSGPAHIVTSPPTLHGTVIGSIYISVDEEAAREAFDGSIAAFTSGVTINPGSQPIEVTGTVGIDATTLPAQTHVIVDEPIPLPIQGSNAVGTIAVPVTGSVGVALQPIWVTGPPANLVNAPIPVSGTVAVEPPTTPWNVNIASPSPLPVTVGNFPAVTAAQITGPFPLSVDLSNTAANPVPLNVNVNTISYPPAPSGNRVNYQNSQAITATTPTLPLLLFPQSTSGYHCYLVVIEVFGFDRQKAITWMLQGRNTSGAYVGYVRKQGDFNGSFSGPYFLMPSTTVAQGVFLNVANQNAIIGTLNVFINIMGWFGPT